MRNYSQESTANFRFFYVVCSCLLAVCYLVTICSSLANQDLYAYLLKEDGPLETIAALAVGLAALLFGICFYQKRPRRLAYLIFFLIFGLLFMEEISWGQRIFDWATPDSISSVNAQNETNFHNHSSIHLYINGILFLFYSLYFIALPILTSAFSRLTRYLRIAKVLVPSEAIALYAFINLVVYRYFFEDLLEIIGFLGPGMVNYAEMLEVGIELTFLLFAIECFEHRFDWS